MLLHSTATGLYYAGEGRWTSSRSQALVFSSGAQAIFCAFEERLRSVEVLFDFDDPSFNIRIPLTDTGRPNP